MAADDVLELSDANFDLEVLRAETPVLVDFTATWCGPCKMIAPVIETIARENPGKYKVAKCDIDDCPDITKRYGVRSVPTVMVFRGGEKRGQYVGFTTKETLLKLLES
jgi:thioredoxin 1